MRVDQSVGVVLCVEGTMDAAVCTVTRISWGVNFFGWNKLQCQSSK